MTSEERLETIKQQLKDRGIKDFKVTLDRDIAPLTLDVIAIQEHPQTNGLEIKIASNDSRLHYEWIMSDVCDALEAYLKGEYHPLPPFNDSVKDAT